ncbi:MAG: trigger factor [Alphaproteobacteria bacterium]|nr:trigger factor [Alphaproteobacteria bacterium]
MQVKQLKQDGLNHELEITVDAGDIAKRVKTRLQEVGKTIKIPGFRPGKVPISLMKKRYGKAVMGEVLEATVNETSVQAVKDQNIKPALQPKIEIKSKTFDEDEDLIYTMAIETLPEIKIEDYKGFKLTKLVAKADDKAIDDALERIASMRKTTQPIDGERATKEGDTVVIDFKGRTADDGVEHQGMAAEGHTLELGSNSFIPGFESQLVGKKASDNIEVKVAFPEEYNAAELAGRDAIFDVTIHEIRESAEAVIDDEFAKSLGMEDIAALRKAVEEQTNNEYGSHSRLKLKKELLDQLDDAHNFEIPQGMKEMELKNILHQIKVDNMQHGITDEPTDEEKEEFEVIAERRVRLGLLLSEIGNENNIQVADAELQQAVISEAKKYPGQEKQVFDYFAKNRETLESLRAPIYEDKVIDFILELAEVTEKEVSVEELTAEDEDFPKKKEPKSKSTKKKSETKEKESKSQKPKTKKATVKKKGPAKKASTKKAS